ncbi:phosphonoacetaldehyde reductase [Balneolaceae bacterium YR4-1]|uniref:Phosphonoacetaldehyde reductase n=1 Tax=Halalkalibaculum roseum TaxID=2709311 RepID=A0A6M1T1P0_9BACT|nr:phosphonoacetaldehyde reductase [Halalkalibaculum roseum]NGP76667.1 phosphonoacetaldehyde reductase [Halalkalibaculum roseum]
MQNEFIGAGTIEEAGRIVESISPQKVFLVSGKRSFELSGAAGVFKKLLGGLDYYRHSEFSENPKFDDLVRGAELIKKYQPDLIIAVGGGSVIDTAKIISVLPTDRHDAEQIIRGETSVSHKIAPLLAIPTTSGSGSEATHFAVAYLDSEKYSVASDRLFPDYVILDPELTYSMSAYQTAVSGIDALCQGIESYWAKRANDESRAYASEAIQLILRSLVKAVNDPNPAVRSNITKGANLAGKAINIAKTTAPHAISYAFTTFYGIPHGHAVALTLGEFFLINTKRAFDKTDNGLMQAMKDLFELMQCNSAEACRDTFQKVMENIGLETKLNKLTSNTVNPSIIVKHINEERLGNHPISLSKKDIHRIITAIL